MAETPFFQQILEPPKYGYEKNGKLYRPNKGEIFAEFFSRLNIFKSRKSWLSFWSWSMAVLLVLPFVLFFTQHFSWPLFAAAFVYGMILMGSHGTLYLHRFGTHRAYKVKNPLVLFFIRNLVIKIIPEEIYVVSHHVHHRYSEKPHDPYNVHCGWLYCFLADVTHQPIHLSLSEGNYAKLRALVKHMGITVNTYEQYQRWGTLCHPLRTVFHYVLNWSFWFGAFFLIGGLPLAIAIFAGAGTWAIGIRTFNFDGHGAGKDKRQDGIDFNREDWSINQVWPGYVAGEWHNNHHLYPSGARSGFMNYQIDLPWYFISCLEKFGLLHSVNDPKAEFIEKHLRPFRKMKLAKNQAKSHA